MTYSPLVEGAIYLSAIFSPEMIILFCWFLAVMAFSIVFLRKIKLKNVFKADAPSFVKSCVLIVGSTAIATILSQMFKRIFRVARPDNALIQEIGYSFPSGHATLVTAFFLSAVVCVYLFYPKLPMPLRRLKVCASILIIVGVCASRLVLRVHRIEDVVFGALIGLVSVLFVQSFFKKDLTVEYKHDNNSHKSH